MANIPFSFSDPGLIRHADLLNESFLYWMKRPLILRSPDISLLEALYQAPFVLVSHGTEADPVFNFANRQAQQLWNISWDEFTQLPSRYSAEPIAQEERESLLKRSRQQGHITNYFGIRISKEGKRFEIQDAILWNVLDQRGDYHGQAALFEHWKFID